MGVEINNLKIIAINVNSIITNYKRYSLHKFLNTHDLDIILLSETKLNPNHKLSLEN